MCILMCDASNEPVGQFDVRHVAVLPTRELVLDLLAIRDTVDLSSNPSGPSDFGKRGLDFTGRQATHHEGSLGDSSALVRLTCLPSTFSTLPIITGAFQLDHADSGLHAVGV